MLLDTSKNNLIRERVCYLRFQNITWLDKEYIIRDFEYKLIRKRKFVGDFKI